MPSIRNPFKIRAAEHIRHPDSFLRLFSAEVLDVIDQDMFLNCVQIFRSSPGAGKTSLLRVFTPPVLLTLYKMRTQDDYNNIFNKLNSLGVISNNGPELLGVSLSCARNYATLEDLKYDEIQRERIFYSLLNSRIILSLLRGSMELKSLEYPNDLDEIQVKFPRTSEIPLEVPLSGTGKNLYDWANKIEEQICEIVDSYGPIDTNRLVGHDTLFSLHLLRPEYLQYRGDTLVNRLSVMFDDVHKLTPVQRTNLLRTIINMRPSASVWLFERFEALNPIETFEGTTINRDYNEIILEKFWKKTPNSKTFERAIRNIADKRTKIAGLYEFHKGSFGDYLIEMPDAELERKLGSVNHELSERVQNEIRSSKILRSWVNEVENIEQSTASPFEKAIAWQTLEILTTRAKAKGQLTLDMTLPEFSLKEDDKSRVREPAALFLAKEFKIPYYYGFTKISACSSLNFDQFLSFAGELFEEIISMSLTKKVPLLSPVRQERILKRVADRKWEEIPRRIPGGRYIQDFLETLCLFAQKETFSPGAPYSPGVTGIAITMEDHKILLDRLKAGKRDEYVNLAHIIAICVSNDLLTVTSDHSQGGKNWWLLYLNRWLCVKFDLPLGYGGWRGKRIGELVKWVT